MKAHPRYLIAILVAALAAYSSAHADPPPASHWREASLADYRQHLLDLDALVVSCAAVRDSKACNPMLVGLDDHVPLDRTPNAERRLIRYGWLRVLLSKAQGKDVVAADAKPIAAARKPSTGSSTNPAAPTTTQLLQDARTRLTQDLAQADETASTTPSPVSEHAAARNSMTQILAGRDFRNLVAPNARDTALEKLGAWLNRFFETLGRLQARSAWLGRAVVWGFITTVCVGLIWALLQLERRWRIRLIPESPEPAAGSASARDWQLWLQDARSSADAGLWRESVHFVYWAAISRLESRRLWPADRARTPREYLALIASDDPRRPALSALTGSFERIWYGGRPAAESDYRQAEELATGLIEGGAQ